MFIFDPNCDQKKWSSGNKFTIFFPGGVETFQTCRFVDSHTFALCRRTGTSRCARVKRGSGSKSRMLRPCPPLGNGKTVGWWMTGHGSFGSLQFDDLPIGPIGNTWKQRFSIAMLNYYRVWTRENQKQMVKPKNGDQTSSRTGQGHFDLAYLSYIFDIV